MSSKTGRIPWNKKEPVILICKNCFKKYGVIPARAKESQFCSLSCKASYTFKGRTSPCAGSSTITVISFPCSHFISITLYSLRFSGFVDADN